MPAVIEQPVHSNAGGGPPTWSEEDPVRPDDGQADAVQELLGRLLSRQQHLFVLRISTVPATAPSRLHGPPSQQSSAWFSVEVHGGAIHVAGTSGVELASGVHWFLKHWVDCSVSWQLTGGVQLNPGAFSPEALRKVRITAGRVEAFRPWRPLAGVPLETPCLAPGPTHRNLHDDWEPGSRGICRPATHTAHGSPLP
jgi:Alpha-N-acetylglucosaminidase (NAGLU) N-terminal domain